jgi:hypothetical protein
VQIKEDEMGEVFSTHGGVEEIRNAKIILVGNSEGKRPHAGPRRRWQDNIKIGLREVGLESVNLIHLGHDKDRWRAVVNTIMNLRVP